MTSVSAPSSTSPEHALLRALRYRGDELQLGRALYAVAREGRAAQRLAQALLETIPAEKRDVAAQLRPVPDDLTGVEQRQLFAEVGRSALRRRMQRMGSIDIELMSPSRGDWRLGVELKLGSGYQPEQIGRYEASGLAVVAIVRRRSSTDPAPHARRWLGEVTWGELLPRLRELPICPAGLAEQWRMFLDVVEAAGDLAGGRRTATSEVRANADLLDHARNSVSEHLAASIRRIYGDSGERFIDALFMSKVRTDNQGRAWLKASWRRPFGDGALYVDLRDASSSEAVVRTWWLSAPTDRRQRRQLRAAHEQLRALGFKDGPPGQYGVEDHQRLSGRTDAADAVAACINARLDQIVVSGCLEGEIDGRRR